MTGERTASKVSDRRRERVGIMALVRRVCVLAVMLFWTGGFTFYAAVVVHVGQDVLGSHRLQGFVTRRVTNFLNLAGAIALPVLAWDAAYSRDRSARRRRLRWSAWAGMGLTLGVLVWMHPRMDGFLEPAAFRILDRGSFAGWHRWYLHVSTIQWVCALAYGLLALTAWRAEDRDLGRATDADTGESVRCNQLRVE